MRRQLAEAGANEPGGLKRSLHIMRGHFKNYRDGRGLFGKIRGPVVVGLPLDGFDS